MLDWTDLLTTDNQMIPVTKQLDQGQLQIIASACLTCLRIEFALEKATARSILVDPRSQQNWRAWMNFCQLAWPVRWSG